MIIFFLYLVSDVRFNILYVKYIVVVVQTRVMMDNMSGKIEPVHNQVSADLKFHGISIEFPSKNVIINIIVLQTIQAIKLHSEFINISGMSIFCGQNCI
jgi:hypothetical protein